MSIKYFLGPKAERQLEYEKVEEGEGGRPGAGGEAGDGEDRPAKTQFHVETETNSVYESSSRRSEFQPKPSGGVDLQKKTSKASSVVDSLISCVSVDVSSSTVPVQVPLKSSGYVYTNADSGSLIPEESKSHNANSFPVNQKSSRRLSRWLDRLCIRKNGHELHSEDQAKRLTVQHPALPSPSHAPVVQQFAPRVANLTHRSNSDKTYNLNGISQSQVLPTKKVIRAGPTEYIARPHSDCYESDCYIGYHGVAPSTCLTKVCHLSEPNALQAECHSRSLGNHFSRLPEPSSNAQQGHASSMQRDQDCRQTSRSLVSVSAGGSSATPITARALHMRNLSLSEAYDEVTWTGEPESCLFSSSSQPTGKRNSISTCLTIPHHLKTVQETQFENGIASPNSALSVISKSTCSANNLRENRRGFGTCPDYRMGPRPPHFTHNHRPQRLEGPNESMGASSVAKRDPILSRADSLNRLEKISSLKNEKQALTELRLLPDRSSDVKELQTNNYAASRSSTVGKDSPAKSLLLGKLSADCEMNETSLSSRFNIPHDSRSCSGARQQCSRLRTNPVSQGQSNTGDQATHRVTPYLCNESRIDQQHLSSVGQRSFKSENNCTMHMENQPLAANELRVSLAQPLSYYSIDRLKLQKATIKSTTSLMSVDANCQIQQHHQHQHQQSGPEAAADNNASQPGPSPTAMHHSADKSSGTLTTLPFNSANLNQFLQSPRFCAKKRADSFESAKLYELPSDDTEPVNRLSGKDISSTKVAGKTRRLKTSCPVDFAKFIPVRLPVPIEIPRILHNHIDASEWDRAQKAFAKDQLGNVTKSQSTDCIQTCNTRPQRTKTTVSECRPLSPAGFCRKTPKTPNDEITSMRRSDRFNSNQPKYQKETMICIPADAGQHLGCMGKRDYPLGSALRFSRSVNEDYCRVASQKDPDFTAVIYLERPVNYNQQLYLIKTELALSALIHFFHPCSSANVFWTTDIRKQLSAILNDQSLPVKPKFNRASLWEVDRISNISVKDRSEPINAGTTSQIPPDQPVLVKATSPISRDRFEPVKAGITSQNSRNRSAPVRAGSTSKIRRDLAELVRATSPFPRDRFKEVKSRITSQSSRNRFEPVTVESTSQLSLNLPEPVRAGISSQFSRDRPGSVGGSRPIPRDPSESDELRPMTSEVGCNCILLLSSDAGRLLRHRQNSVLPHLATALATDVEDVVVLVKVSE